MRGTGWSGPWDEKKGIKMDMNKFIQQVTANFVAVDLRNQSASAARRDRLKALMNGTTVTEGGVVKRYRFEFEGVAPITELLDPAWCEPVAPVTRVLVVEPAEQADPVVPVAA